MIDVMMPGMDGYDPTRAMQADAALKLVPIILLTAKADDSMAAWMKSADRELKRLYRNKENAALAFIDIDDTVLKNSQTSSKTSCRIQLRPGIHLLRGNCVSIKRFVHGAG